jgi:prephenate dehydrogenase
LNISIVGANGAMGSFFARYFASRGHNVLGFDIKRQKGSGQGPVMVASLELAVRQADAVMLATPMTSMGSVGRKALLHMKRGSYLIEISSVKGNLLPTLRRLSRARGVELLSIHPLFGPAQNVSDRMKLLVVMTGKNSRSLAHTFFPNAEIYTTSPALHDRLMSLILSLTHATNAAFVSVVKSNIKPQRLKRMATPFSYLQLILGQAILSQSPELMAEIQAENRYSEEVLRSMISELTRIADLVRDKNTEELTRAFAIQRQDSSSRNAIDSVYRAYRSIVS